MLGWQQAYRRFLLGLDLLNWRRDTAVFRAESPPPPDKTLLVGSLLTIPATLKAEAVYARALQTRGYRPVFALNQRSSYNLSLLRSLLGGDLRIVTPQDYAQPGEDAAREQASALVRDHACVRDLIALEVEGVRVGRNSLSTVVRTLRTSHVDLADPDHRARIEAAVANSLIASRRYARLLDDVRPQRTLFNERGYTPAGELFDACLVRGLNTVQWLGAPQSDHQLYKRYRLATRGQHPLALSDTTWARLSAASWSQTQDRKLMAQLASHYESGAWFNRQQLHEGKSMMTPAQVRTHLGVAGGRKIAVIFSHILYDATFFYGDSLYPDYASWLVETVRGAIANPQIHWVVKVHPVNVWRARMDNAPLEQLEARILREAFGVLPQNISIMPADTPVNTHALFQTIDYGLTVRGTVGMELPCYGIPTITAGTGRYSGRGFTLDPVSTREYQTLLGRLHAVPPLDAQTVAMARRYAYGTFFLRPQPLESFRMLYHADSFGLAELKMNLSVRAQGGLANAADLAAFGDFIEGDTDDFLSDIPHG
jgi:hypothetical protein